MHEPPSNTPTASFHSCSSSDEDTPPDPPPPTLDERLRSLEAMLQALHSEVAAKLKQAQQRRDGHAGGAGWAGGGGSASSGSAPNP